MRLISFSFVIVAVFASCISLAYATCTLPTSDAINKGAIGEITSATSQLRNDAGLGAERKFGCQVLFESGQQYSDSRLFAVDTPQDSISAVDMVFWKLSDIMTRAHDKPRYHLTIIHEVRRQIIEADAP